MPDNYMTDPLSYITEMGLHHLDKLMTYTVDNVNLNPVILYGSFEGDVLFFEGSITAYGFQSVQTNGT